MDSRELCLGEESGLAIISCVQEHEADVVCGGEGEHAVEYACERDGQQVPMSSKDPFSV